MVGIGAGQPVRGRKHRQHRPGRIVLDDIEDDQSVLNPRLVHRLVAWVFGAVFPSLEPGGSLVWLGTLLSLRSGLASAMGREGAAFHKWKAEPEPGVSLWEDRFPAAELPALKRLVGTIVWYREYQNEPGDDPDAPFQLAWIDAARYRGGEIDGIASPGLFFACDPSLEEGRVHDFKAIVGVRVLHEWAGKKGPFYAVVAP